MAWNRLVDDYDRYLSEWQHTIDKDDELERYRAKELMRLVNGKSISVGDGFVWITKENFDWGSYSYVCSPVLLGIEAVMALFDAADALDLTEKDMENIFYYNAHKIT